MSINLVSRLIRDIDMDIAYICTMKNGVKLTPVSHFSTGELYSHPSF